MKDSSKMRPLVHSFPALLGHLREVPALTLPLWRALWKTAVGPAVTARTRVIRFERGTLAIRVSHSAWFQQLTRLKPELLAALNQAVGQPIVKEIEFYLTEKEPLLPTKEATLRKESPTLEFDGAFLKLDQLRDPKLRELLLRTARKYFDLGSRSSR